jgi:hypothetical protein
MWTVCEFAQLAREASAMPLSGVEYEIASALAAPLPRSQRENFLVAIEGELQAWPEQARGPGLVHRVAANLQKRFFDAPPRPSPAPQHFNARRFPAR